MNSTTNLEKRPRPMNCRVLPASALIAALGLVLAAPAVAEESMCPVAESPRVSVAPSPIYVSGAGPWIQEIQITVDLIDNVPSYDDLAVLFDGVLAYSGEKPSPPAGNNVCTTKTDGTGTCSPGTTETQVVITYVASFDELRSYPVEVNATKSGPNDVCETAYFVVLEFVTAEFKAPPAIANEYINEFYESMPGKRRGCVISRIANHHAHESKYGAKGGDATLYPTTGYDVYAIEKDVDYYFGAVCTR